MVNTNTLAELAEQLDLGSYLYLGKGIARGGGRSLKSLLANAFEALLGAIFLDAGYDAAYHYYLNRYRSLPEPAQDENFKGRLQQVAQERFGQTPVYDSEGAKVGSKREYTSVVFAGAEPLGTGHGMTKQESEQEAARAALESLVGAIKPVTAVKPPRSRARRGSRQPRRSAKSEAASAEPALESPVPLSVLPSGDAAPQIAEPPPSRQFGEPLE